MIKAHLTGSDTIECQGTTLKHRTPILALCRKLESEGHGPELLTVYRGPMPVIEPVIISDAAKLTVLENENLPIRFAKYRPFVAL